MGPQQVLRAATAVLIARAAVAAPQKEDVAVIDLGPDDGGLARRTIEPAIVAAGLRPIEITAGFKDDAALAGALADAKQAFGELDCKKAVLAARIAIGQLATRQAAGIPVPELPRAWSYVLLCADRTSDSDLALHAAAMLRAVGGSPDVPQAVMDKYPEIDSVADRDLIDIDVKTEPGAAVWVDFQSAGTAPLHLVLASGEHIIAAASGTKRGYVTGTVSRKQPVVEIKLDDMAGKWNALAARIAGWHGALPKPDELAAVLAEVGVRIAFVRHDDTVEVWGHAGKLEPLGRLGGDDGVRTLDEADRVAALAVDRVQAWDSHAPDPDRPLLVDTPQDRARRSERVDEPTKWWVYAAIGGAVLAGAAIIYAHDTASNTQHVELHYP